MSIFHKLVSRLELPCNTTIQSSQILRLPVENDTLLYQANMVVLNAVTFINILQLIRSKYID